GVLRHVCRDERVVHPVPRATGLAAEHDGPRIERRRGTICLVRDGEVHGAPGASQPRLFSELIREVIGSTADVAVNVNDHRTPPLLKAVRIPCSVPDQAFATAMNSPFMETHDTAAAASLSR